MPNMLLPLTQDMHAALESARNEAKHSVLRARSPESEVLGRIEYLLDRGLKCISRSGGVTPGCLIDLNEACFLAMRNTIRARIPECGDFGGVAQDLGFVLDRLCKPDEVAA